MPRLRILLLLGLGSLLVARVWSQGGGTITGVVTDPSGAVVPRARVLAKNVATGVETVRITTEAGVYVISPLPVGEYRLTVSADGFMSTSLEKIVVDALSSVAVNVTLPLGSMAQEVTITDTPPQLSTADARLGTTVRNEEYRALPLAMGSGTPRNPTAFVFLQPGVTNTSRWGNTLGGQDFSNDVYVDGVAVTNPTVQGEGRNLSLGVSVDAVEQFQAETAGTAVQFNGQGAQNYVIKSGTNQFHGSAFNYFRNTVLDARGFFRPTRPQQNQNEFGFTLGGPIRKNKLFFFGSFSGYEYRAATAASFFSIPSLAFRRGDFSSLPVPIFDPNSTSCPPGGVCSRTPFSGNVIPASRLSPISLVFQADLPTPTNGNIQNNYLGSVGTGFSNYNTTNKIDYVWNEKHSFAYLYSFGKRSQTTPYRGNTLPLPYAVTRLVEEIPTTTSIKHTWTLRPNLINQVSYGFSRLNVPIQNATIDGKWAEKAGLRGLPPGEARDAFPEISFSGPNSPAGWRGTDARAFTETLNTFTLQNNLQWVKSKHSLTFGYQMQRMQSNQKERTYGSLATWNFSNNQTAGFNAAGVLQATQGNSYASFLLGTVNSATVIEDFVVGTGGRFRNYAGWVQDDFRVSQKLTLNLGLRYDLALPYVEVADRWSFMNPDLPNPAASGRPGALQFAGFGPHSCKCRTPIKNYYGAWGPRLGLAYQIGSKTVLRSSYGIMYSRRGAIGGRGGARNGTGLLGYSAQVTFPSIDGFTPAFNWNAGVPSYTPAPFFDPTLNTGFTTERATGAGITFGDFEIGARPPRYQNFSFGFQHALTNTTTLGVSYVGSNGRFLGGGGRGIYSNQIDPKYLRLGALLQQRATPANIALAQQQFPEIALPFANFSPNATISQMLRPFPQYSSVNDIWGNVGNSHYNSLQVTLQQRRWRGLSVNWNYTWARIIDDTEGSRSAYNWKTERSASSDDLVHVMNATFVYQSPADRGPRWLRLLSRDWQLSGISQFSTGLPLGPIGATCNLPNAGSCYADYAPQFSGPVRINGAWGDGDLLGPNPPSFIDRNAFAVPAPFTYGTTPRTLAYGLRAPNSYNIDLGLRRSFPIRERLRFALQADAINAFNFVVFGGIGTNITNANFGRVSNQANAPRTVQLSARIEF
ncbi:MAG: TonB-dependent receptor [Bryobacteraceae bacterium]|nr:TonB-dependent receptor [Bryobacteraceae bacterium]MDW8377828.1 TonB-dependent receptor [Bryobacterales bacterium]